MLIYIHCTYPNFKESVRCCLCPQESRAIHERFIEQCFLHLEDLMDDTGAAPRTSTGKVSDSDLKLQAIERLLLLAQRYIAVVEVSAM